MLIPSRHSANGCTIQDVYRHRLHTFLITSITGVENLSWWISNLFRFWILSPKKKKKSFSSTNLPYTFIHIYIIYVYIALILKKYLWPWRSHYIFRTCFIIYKWGSWECLWSLIFLPAQTFYELFLWGYNLLKPNILSNMLFILCLFL